MFRVVGLSDGLHDFHGFEGGGTFLLGPSETSPSPTPEARTLKTLDPKP